MATTNVTSQEGRVAANNIMEESIMLVVHRSYFDGQIPMKSANLAASRIKLGAMRH